MRYKHPSKSIFTFVAWYSNTVVNRMHYGQDIDVYKNFLYRKNINWTRINIFERKTGRYLGAVYR